MTSDEQLKNLKKSIESSGPKEETVRNVLSWFGFRRRGTRVLTQLEEAFRDVGLRPTPDLSRPWIDGVVVISVASTTGEEGPRYEALIPRLAHLSAANRVPVSVKREHPISKATTLMLQHNFSQLPVMADERTVSGMISWRTIGEAAALGKTTTIVGDCMETTVRTLDQESPLIDAIDAIVEHEFVMVLTRDKKILGPITTTDLAGRYHVLAEPFLLISQIESAIRSILHTHASEEELKGAKFGDDDRSIQRPEDLTFGEYKTAMANEAIWKRIGTRLDQKQVLAILEDARVARNDIMHFHPDDDAAGTVKVLRDAARLLQRIAKSCSRQPSI